MTRPKKASAATDRESAEANSAEPQPQDVGEAPGSPAYFGVSDAAGHGAPDVGPDYEMVADTGPGDPPGSAAYWGVDPATPAASRGPDGAELPLSTVGVPPGSASYFGTGGS